MERYVNINFKINKMDGVSKIFFVRSLKCIFFMRRWFEVYVLIICVFFNYIEESLIYFYIIIIFYNNFVRD